MSITCKATIDHNGCEKNKSHREMKYKSEKQEKVKLWNVKRERRATATKEQERDTQQGVHRDICGWRQQALVRISGAHSISKTNTLLLYGLMFLPLMWLMFWSAGLARCITSVLPQWQSSRGCKERPVPSHKQAKRCHSALVTALVWPFQSHYSHSNC